MRRYALALAICASLSAQVKLPPYTREALPNGVDYATSVEAAYSLTNQGSVDQIDEEVFPRAAS